MEISGIEAAEGYTPSGGWRWRIQMQEVSGSFRSPESKRKTDIRLDVRYSGGDKRDRTADLLNAIQALSQLSYTPIFLLRLRCLVRNKMYNTRPLTICQQLFSNFSNFFIPA